jgi:DNA-binding PadR family transcriptional regulator
MTPTKSDLPQGTLDLLILIIAHGPVHGYAIAQRLDQVSRGVSRFPRARFTRHCTGLRHAAYSPNWKETETGHEAKFYSLTRKGRAQLQGRKPELAATDRGHRTDSQNV